MMFKKLVNLKFFAFLLILINQNSFGQLLPANRFYNPDVIGSFIWDNTPSNGVVNNGNGTWNTTDLNWLLIPSGANKTWISGRNATFGGNPGIGAAGMVTVSGTQNVKSLFFRNTPSGNFTLTAGILNLQGGLIVTDQDATIASTTQGGGNFIKRGDAKLTLTGNNTFTGSITVSQGGLYLGSSTAIGLTSVILGDATTNNSNVEWRWAGGFTPSNNITVTNQGTGIVTLGAYSVGTNTEHSGNINISRDVTFYDASNDRSTFTGVISGTADYINIDGTGTWNSSTGQVARVTFRNDNTFVATIKILANKAFQFDGSNAVNNNTFENNGSLVLNVGANGIASLGGLNGASTGICEIHPQVTGPQTFSIGNNNADGNYNGIFRNGSGGKVVNIIKTGTGTQLFNGTSTNTGTTIVNNGVLGGTGALNNTSSTTVNTNGKLQGGTGLGNAGVFNVRTLTFNGSAAINVYSNGTTLSRINVTGTCTTATSNKINLMEAMPAGTFTIISASGTLSTNLPTIDINNSGRTVAISRSGNNLQLTLT